MPRRCINCGEFTCQRWFSDPRTYPFNYGHGYQQCIATFEVEGHIDHSYARQLVFDIGTHVGGPGHAIFVSPGFRSNTDLNQFLEMFKQTQTFDPNGCQLYYVHMCAQVPDLAGFFITPATLARLYCMVNPMERYVIPQGYGHGQYVNAIEFNEPIVGSVEVNEDHTEVEKSNEPLDEIVEEDSV